MLIDKFDLAGGSCMKRANGTNSVYKTADGFWVGQIIIGKYDNGKPKYKRFKSKKQATVIEKMREYENGFENTTANSDAYLDAYLLGYLNNVKKNIIKPSSFDRDMNTYSLIKRYIGQYTLSELNLQLIQTYFINKLKEDGYSYSTTHKAFVLLNECMKYAVNNKKISENPCNTVKQPTRANFQTKEIHFLDEDEIKKFVDCATAIKPNGKPYYKYGLICYLDIYTGLRCGELCALKWQDIDFNNKFITVNKTISTTYDYNEDGTKRKHKVQCADSTKTDSGNRVVNLNSKSLRILEQLKEGCGDDFCLDYYIATNSLKCCSVSTMSDAYTTIANSAGIENPLGIHSLRHHNNMKTYLLKFEVYKQIYLPAKQPLMC